MSGGEEDFEGWQPGRSAWTHDGDGFMAELQFVDRDREMFANGGVFRVVKKQRSFRFGIVYQSRLHLLPCEVFDNRDAATKSARELMMLRVELAKANLSKAEANLSGTEDPAMIPG